MSVKCPWPVVKSSGLCCGTEPCSLEWERPCDAFGGCIDRSTCAGCDEPKVARAVMGMSRMWWPKTKRQAER